jgi:hypothetical protein
LPPWGGRLGLQSDRSVAAGRSGGFFFRFGVLPFRWHPGRGRALRRVGHRLSDRDEAATTNPIRQWPKRQSWNQLAKLRNGCVRMPYQEILWPESPHVHSYPFAAGVDGPTASVAWVADGYRLDERNGADPHFSPSQSVDQMRPKHPMRGCAYQVASRWATRSLHPVCHVSSQTWFIRD